MTKKTDEIKMSLIMGTALLVTARKQSGKTRSQIARKMKVPLNVIEEIEALDEDSYLALVLRYAEAIGVKMNVEITLINNESAMRSLDEGRDKPNGLST